MIALFPKLLDLSVKKDIDYLTWMVREYFVFEQSKHPKLDMDLLIKNFEIPFSYKQHQNLLGAMAMDDPKGKLRVEMWVSPNLPSWESNFLKAHLLGHFFLHMQPVIASGSFLPAGYVEKNLPSTRYIKSLTDDVQNLEADQFAAALLMPKSMALKAMEVLKDSQKAAGLFGVSEKLIQKRFLSLTHKAAQDKSADRKTEQAKPFERLRALAKKIDQSCW